MKTEFTLLIDNIIKMRETMINHLKHFEGKTLDEKSLSKKIFLEFMLMDLEVLLSKCTRLVDTEKEQLLPLDFQQAIKAQVENMYETLEASYTQLFLTN